MRLAEAERTARRAARGASRASFKGEHLGKTNKGVGPRASVMGTYASDDSDDEGSVVSVVRHGELASVVERRATQIRHVLRDGPPTARRTRPPAVRVRRGDLDPFALQRRARGGHVLARGRGPGTVEALEAWREARQPRQARGVAGRAHDRGRPGGVRVATEGCVRASSTIDPRVVSAEVSRRVRRRVRRRDRHGRSPLRIAHATRRTRAPRARARRLARAAVRRPAVLRPGAIPDVPEFRLASTAEPLAGRFV